GTRALLVIARARSLPSLRCGNAGGGVPKESGVCPARFEPIARPPLLNGTCTRSRLSDSRNNLPQRCDGVPVPGEAKLYLPGLALIRATKSRVVCAGTDGWTVNTVVVETASVIGSKSLIGSKGMAS